MSIALAPLRVPLLAPDRDRVDSWPHEDGASVTTPTAAAPSDTDLLRRIAQGDRAAFGHFYDRFSRPLYATALRILRDAAEAQDVIHDVFVTVWEKASTYEAHKGSPFSWVVTLVRHRAVDRLRSRRRRSELLSESALSDLGYDEQAPGRAADAEAIFGDERDAVHGALAELNPDQRKALELAFFSGLTQEQIAESLHEPLGTVKARIRRGLMKLQELLASRS